jgi:hypothetical protein
MGVRRRTSHEAGTIPAGTRSLHCRTGGRPVFLREADLMDDNVLVFQNTSPASTPTRPVNARRSPRPHESFEAIQTRLHAQSHRQLDFLRTQHPMSCRVIVAFINKVAKTCGWTDRLSRG